jgi:hypothetical protein
MFRGVALHKAFALAQHAKLQYNFPALQYSHNNISLGECYNPFNALGSTFTLPLVEVFPLQLHISHPLYFLRRMA